MIFHKYRLKKCILILEGRRPCLLTAPFALRCQSLSLPSGLRQNDILSARSSIASRAILRNLSLSSFSISVRHLNDAYRQIPHFVARPPCTRASSNDSGCACRYPQPSTSFITYDADLSRLSTSQGFTRCFVAQNISAFRLSPYCARQFSNISLGKILTDCAIIAILGPATVPAQWLLSIDWFLISFIYSQNWILL